MNFYQQVEEEKEESKPKTKKIEKTVWDWEILNDSKPIWTRKPADITDSEYNEFYKALTKDSKDPLAKVHFIAEGEVTFKSVLFVPQAQPGESFNRYGSKTDHIKVGFFLSISKNFKLTDTQRAVETKPIMSVMGVAKRQKCNNFILFL